MRFKRSLIHLTVTRASLCARSIVSRQLPLRSTTYPRGVTGHLAHPIDSFAPALSPSRVCPSMSRLPSTLRSLHSSDGNDSRRFDGRRLGLVGDQFAQERNEHDERNTDREASGAK